jgi:hypothetical protein
MASYIQLPTRIDSQDCNPTPQQRAVYSYHEALDSDAADDIYSFEWFQRTKSFCTQFAKQDATHVTTLTTWELVEDLDFGAFFLAHPVAAYYGIFFRRAMSSIVLFADLHRKNFA